MLLDALAERYGCMPSQVLQQGDSFDIMVMDVALTYRAYEKQKAEGKGISPDIIKRMFGGQEELEDFYYSLKGVNNDSKDQDQ